VAYSRNWRFHYTLQSVIFGATLLAIAILVVLLSLASRARLVEEARTNALNMAEIISDDIDQTVSRAHSDIRSFSLFVKNEDLVASVSAERRREIESLMASHLTTFPQVANFRIFTASGDTVFGSGKNPATFNVSDRKWFVSLRDDATLQVAISDVLVSKAMKVPTIIIGTPIRGADGRFLGAVNASLDLTYFQHLIERPAIGGNAVIAIRRSETSNLILRRPVVETLTNEPIASPLTHRISSGELTGTMEVSSGLDKVSRVMAFKKVSDYPIVTIVGLAHDDFLKQWRLQTWAASTTTLVFEVLLAFLYVRQFRIQLRLNCELLERKQAEVALKESENRFHTVVDSAREGIAVHQDGIIVFVNPAMAKMIGVPSTSDLVGKPALDMVHPDFRQMVLSRQKAHADSGLPMPTEEEKFIRFDHRAIDVEVQGAAIVFMGKPAVQVAVRDITERKFAEAKLKLAASVFENAREGITITDVNGTIIEVNEAFTRITGYSREEAIGQNPRLLQSGRQDSAFYKSMWDDLVVRGHWSGEVWNRRRSGEVYAEMISISAVKDEKGETQKYLALFSDISGIKEHQRQLEHIAHFDALTNLPNRLLLTDRLQRAMAQAKRRDQMLAVIYLDLDGFKNVNDQHGHEKGDQLLIHLASSMSSSLREGDTLARIGGDEFVAVLIDLAGIETCMPMVTRLLEAAAAPVQCGDLGLKCSASIGVTFYPQEDTDVQADQLLRQADQAMYQAKLAGKNRFHVFDAALDSNLRVHHESLERVRLALNQREFVLHYQPKVNMRSGKVIGVEALIRWQHPEKGLLAPATFLPVIEDHLLAVELGEWVIDSALAQVEAWAVTGLDLAVSVNIGALQLQQVDFVERLQRTLAMHSQVKSTKLELEILETSALADMDQVSQVIEDCRDLGVMFALDDFGTGYSSLTYLKQLRVATLKIDQSFVRDMLEDPDDLAILEGVIGLANAFRREVIAEGVETVAHGTALLQLGCELAQGYGIARPMPPEQMTVWVTAWEPDSDWRVGGAGHVNGS
jgi:diguanylate cyclase (GGDEF)-like protein/PAS domain S-box-containing protein